MLQSSALVMKLARHGANRVLQGEVPELKNPRNLTELQGEQNIDFFEESFQDLKSRDNSAGDVSMHFFSAGPDEAPEEGKVKVGNLEAEYQGDTGNGTRFSLEDRGDVAKLKAHRFDESKVVVYEATIKPNNEMSTNVLILDRDNPGQSLIGAADSNWTLFG